MTLQKGAVGGDADTLCRTDALATGTTTLDMNCTTTAEGVSRCIPKNAGAGAA